MSVNGARIIKAARKCCKLYFGQGCRGCPQTNVFGHVWRPLQASAQLTCCRWWLAMAVAGRSAAPGQAAGCRAEAGPAVRAVSRRDLPAARGRTAAPGAAADLASVTSSARRPAVVSHWFAIELHRVRPCLGSNFACVAALKAVPGAKTYRGQNFKFRGQQSPYKTTTYMPVPAVPGVPGAKRNGWKLKRGTSRRSGGVN